MYMYMLCEREIEAYMYSVCMPEEAIASLYACCVCIYQYAYCTVSQRLCLALSHLLHYHPVLAVCKDYMLYINAVKCNTHVSPIPGFPTALEYASKWLFLLGIPSHFLHCFVNWYANPHRFTRRVFIWKRILKY